MPTTAMGSRSRPSSSRNRPRVSLRSAAARLRYSRYFSSFGIVLNPSPCALLAVPEFPVEEVEEFVDGCRLQITGESLPFGRPVPAFQGREEFPQPFLHVSAFGVGQFD